ncbi:hypothetical protein [uncultured Desulfosarcina sp.]|uniref:hypothetical protein n=1 Tax=uncultured Desulfosarcina sp. TaxID=218289 RepID=UPI0029C9138A|nr:hypothetical protein [uncultured Desulfosarcina sp.]
MKKLFIIFAILCLAAPVMAADWSFYGSSRINTWRSVNDIGNPTESDDDTTWGQQGNSRLGATVKLNDQIGGGFEYGTGVNVRKLYGTYTFGNGAELLLGQTYTPTGNYFYSNSVYNVDNDLFGVGQFYAGRQPMIQFKMAGFKIALVKPNTSAGNPVGNDDARYGYYDAAGAYQYVGVVAADDVSAAKKALKASDGSQVANSWFQVSGETGTVSDNDVDLPKIEASYQFKTDMFFVDVFGGYQSYTADGAAKEYDIDSYVIGIGGGVTFGPAYFNAGYHMGTNFGNYGNSGFLPPENATATQGTSLGEIGYADYDPVKDEIVDNDSFGYLAVLGFNASEMFTIEAGYGFQEYELDEAGSKASNIEQYYVNCTINIAPGFFIVPEVGKVNFEFDDADGGDYTYYGAKWQINF